MSHSGLNVSFYANIIVDLVLQINFLTIICYSDITLGLLVEILDWKVDKKTGFFQIRLAYSLTHVQNH